MLNLRAVAMMGASALIGVVVFVVLLYLGFGGDLFALSIVCASFGLTACLIDGNYRLLGNEARGKAFDPDAGGHFVVPVWCSGIAMLLVAAGIFGLGVLASSQAIQEGASRGPAPAPRAAGADPNDKPSPGTNGFVSVVDESLRRTFSPPDLAYDKWWPPEPVDYQGKQYWGVRVRYFHRSRSGSQDVAEKTAVILGGVVIGWMNERDLGPRSTFMPGD